MNLRMLGFGLLYAIVLAAVVIPVAVAVMLWPGPSLIAIFLACGMAAAAAIEP